MTTEQEHGDEVREALRPPLYWNIRARLGWTDEQPTYAGGPWELVVVRRTKSEAIQAVRAHIVDTDHVPLNRIQIVYCTMVPGGADHAETLLIDSHGDLVETAI